MSKNLPVLIISLIIIFECGCSKSAATKFYISNNGNDKNSGISPSSPWKTITKVNSMTFKPGDSIFFERGGTWRIPEEEALQINSSGSTKNHIYYGAYGEGNKPRIIGSNKITGWTKVRENIWSAALSYNPRKINYGGELFFRSSDNSTKWGLNVKYSDDFAEMEQDLDWTWNNNVAYVRSEINPDERFVDVEAPKTQRLIFINDQEYITIDNFEVAYCILIGIYDSYKPSDVKGLTITNCHIHHIGHKDSGQGFGLSVRHSDMRIANNDIHDCGRRNISLVTYENLPTMHISNIIIENNYLHDGWHTTGVDLNTTGTHVVDSVIIRNNLFFEPDETNLTKRMPNKSLTSNTIFISQQGTGNIGNVYIYNNIFNGHHGTGVLMDHVHDIYIVNNTFCKFNPTLKGYYSFIGASKGVENVHILNNIFYDNGLTVNERDLFCISYMDTSSLAVKSDYNLFYEVDPTNRTIMFQNLGGAKLYYHYTIFQMAGYCSFHNRDKNSIINEDPLFVDMEMGNFNLQKKSTAIGTGTPVSWVTTDYFGKPRNSQKQTLGAIESTTNE